RPRRAGRPGVRHELGVGRLQLGVQPGAHPRDRRRRALHALGHEGGLPGAAGAGGDGAGRGGLIRPAVPSWKTAGPVPAVFFAAAAHAPAGLLRCGSFADSHASRPRFPDHATSSTPCRSTCSHAAAPCPPARWFRMSPTEECAMKVLACDGIHEDGLALLRAAGGEVVSSDPIKEPAALAAALEDVDVLLVRSATRGTAGGLVGAERLRVIGRAGAGVDTIDVDAATARGIAVMNAPDGNTLAAAEHAISLLFALARHVPRADAGMKAGQWPKAGLTGFELEGKKLGVIGLGRIGGTVA